MTLPSVCVAALSPIAGAAWVVRKVRRTGYANASQLRRILVWAGVRILTAQSRHERGAGHRFHIVDPLDVDDAIARWMATESVDAAAKRHSVCGGTLVRWLRAAGHEISRVKPERRGCSRERLHQRIESAVVDKVVAARRAPRTTESLAEAARRYGMSSISLSRWLRQAGMQNTTGYHWTGLNPKAVDAVVAEHRARKTCRVARRGACEG